jgi:hypothetical protein
MKISINSNIKKFQTALNNLAGLKAQVMPKVFQTFYDVTPYKTGNAKSKTRLKGQDIEANYAYAGVLDAGRHMTNKGMRGSTQAPKGMSTPARATLDKEVKKFLAKSKGK